jgi:hypothetical protein
VCRHIPEALRTVVRTLASTEPTTFKIGSDVHGLLRPDKIVLYFTTAAALRRCADYLLSALRETPAHGVPFSAAVDSTGILSSGIDPPQSDKLLSWRESESWRLWTTNRLAVYLLTARATADRHTRIPPHGFARRRLELDGVDTRTWSPVATTWLSPAMPPA